MMNVLSVRKTREWTLGLIFLGCVIILWVLSSFLLNDLFELGTYSKPFLITWFNTAAFSLYLIPYFWNKGARSKDNKTDVTSDDDDEVLFSAGHEDKPPLTFRETVQLSFWFSILWFTSNFFNNASLLFTSVSSQTILSSTSSFFTIMIGYFLKMESLNNTKVVSLLISFIGVLCVTVNDDPQTTSDPLQSIFVGDILALLGAVCYGIYSILLKLKVGDDSRVDMTLFFGFVGVFNTILLWPSLILVNRLGYETFALPPTSHIWMVLLFNCFISFLADFLWARAMLLTSPLTVTVGLCLTIPVAMLCDIIFKFKWNSPVYFLGAILVCISFYFINKNEQESQN